jgi:hypothetical protein
MLATPLPLSLYFFSVCGGQRLCLAYGMGVDCGASAIVAEKACFSLLYVFLFYASQGLCFRKESPVCGNRGNCRLRLGKRQEQCTTFFDAALFNSLFGPQGADPHLRQVEIT